MLPALELNIVLGPAVNIIEAVLFRIGVTDRLNIPEVAIRKLFGLGGVKERHDDAAE